MYKPFLVLPGLVLCISFVQAQQSSIDALLQTVKSNNQSLSAYRSYMEGETLQFELENKLPGLQAFAYYLPFGRNSTGNYNEFEIFQRVEFPTVYMARADWINNQQERLEYAYQKLEQEILLKAKKLGLELIYMQKLQALVEERVTQYEKVYEQVQTLFDQGQTGVLELNKAKIVWLDQQFALEELKTERRQIEQELQGLNGGREITFQLDAYPNTIKLPSVDSLWNQRLKQDAEIVLLEKKKQVAQQRLKVARNQLLPDITGGYNYQGVAGSNYSGIYGGIRIPLWRGKNKVKMAEVQVDYYDQHQSEVITSLKSKYLSRIQRYQFLLNKFRKYKKALEGLNSETLLQKSYELGEISFLDYYREITFYRDAENRMLEIEKNLQQLRAELFKHQL